MSTMQLLSDTLDHFDDPDQSIAASARRALRIAAQRHDYVAELWLMYELNELRNGGLKENVPAAAKTLQQMESLFGTEAAQSAALEAFRRWERNRVIAVDGGEDKIYWWSIGQLEAHQDLVQTVYGEMVVPEGLTPVDTYFVAKDIDASKAKLIPDMHQVHQLVERTRSAIYSFLVDTESAIAVGEVESPLFVRAREYIDQGLARLAPSAQEKFVAAQDALLSGSSEDLAHAVASCRRMIKALADVLYPVPEESVLDDNGNEIRLDDSAYRNRLIQFARDKIGDSQKKVLDTTLSSLVSRLKALDSLASKGVHGEVTSAEAETCIMWTYMLASDFLRLADGESSLLDTDREIPTGDD